MLYPSVDTEGKELHPVRIGFIVRPEFTKLLGSFVSAHLAPNLSGACPRR